VSSCPRPPSLAAASTCIKEKKEELEEEDEIDEWMRGREIRWMGR
jgi:hypothetical protein